MQRVPVKRRRSDDCVLPHPWWGPVAPSLFPVAGSGRWDGLGHMGAHTGERKVWRCRCGSGVVSPRPARGGPAALRARQELSAVTAQKF